MLPDNKNGIMKIVDSKFKHAEIFESEMNPTEFKLDMRKIK